MSHMMNQSHFSCHVGRRSIWPSGPVVVVSDRTYATVTWRIDNRVYDKIWSVQVQLGTYCFYDCIYSTFQVVNWKWTLFGIFLESGKLEHLWAAMGDKHCSKYTGENQHWRINANLESDSTPLWICSDNDKHCLAASHNPALFITSY